MQKATMDRAIADYDQAIRLNPADKNALAFRANANKKRRPGQRDPWDYDQLVQLVPRNPRTYRARAMARLAGWITCQITDRSR